MQNWRNSYTSARLGESLDDGRVRCHLSPRKCVIREGGDGFCKVRGVRNGRLVTMNYSKSVHPTQETIETEAVNHFAPGAKILSCGNIGCMMSCSYCHNWRTSQAKFVQDGDVFHLTPEYAVDTAIRRELPVISYTYNDPVVWHEWVVDTARHAKENGLVNLYKSAFYISDKAIDELIDDIDIFSISLKSLDPEYYKKYTGGRLEPVLEGIKQVYASGRHLELSTLMITDVSDNNETAKKITDWVLENLDENVPIHFVRFHPDFRMTDSTRTPVDRLVAARQLALDAGLKHVYLGNVYDNPASDTICGSCNALLVSRYGLHASVKGLTEDGRCKACGTDAHIKRPFLGIQRADAVQIPPNVETSNRQVMWRGDVRSLHVEAVNATRSDLGIYVRDLAADGSVGQWRLEPVFAGQSWRFIVAKSAVDHVGSEIAVPNGIQTNLHEVFDRAHFPTVRVEESAAGSDVTPLPAYTGRPLAPAE
jgi:pyruvate formate lyase activating enzyme